MTIKNILEIKNNITNKISELKYSNYEPNIIAVSKTFPIDDIIPLIEYKHCPEERTKYRSDD